MTRPYKNRRLGQRIRPQCESTRTNGKDVCRNPALHGHRFCIRHIADPVAYGGDRPPKWKDTAKWVVNIYEGNTNDGFSTFQD
jgi:hypothetical protein